MAEATAAGVPPGVMAAVYSARAAAAARAHCTAAAESHASAMDGMPPALMASTYDRAACTSMGPFTTLPPSSFTRALPYTCWRSAAMPATNAGRRSAAATCSRSCSTASSSTGRTSVKQWRSRKNDLTHLRMRLRASVSLSNPGTSCSAASI